MKKFTQSTFVEKPMEFDKMVLDNMAKANGFGINDTNNRYVITEQLKRIPSELPGMVVLICTNIDDTTYSTEISFYSAPRGKERNLDRTGSMISRGKSADELKEAKKLAAFFLSCYSGVNAGMLTSEIVNGSNGTDIGTLIEDSRTNTVTVEQTSAFDGCCLRLEMTPVSVRFEARDVRAIVKAKALNILDEFATKDDIFGHNYIIEEIVKERNWPGAIAASARYDPEMGTFCGGISFYRNAHDFAHYYLGEIKAEGKNFGDFKFLVGYLACEYARALVENDSLDASGFIVGTAHTWNANQEIYRGGGTYCRELRLEMTRYSVSFEANNADDIYPHAEVVIR